MRSICALAALVCNPPLYSSSRAVAGDNAPPVRLLNGRGQVVAPGTVYVIDSRVTPIAELIAARPLNVSGGLIKREDAKAPGPVLIGHDDGAVVTFLPKVVVTEKLVDPFDCLEIVNRPTTGYAYNRDAELRIAQWRTSLGAAVHKSSRGGDVPPRVAVCASTDIATEGTIVVAGAGDKTVAAAAVNAVLASTGCEVDLDKAVARLDAGAVKYDFPIAKPVVIAASLRELSLVDTTTQPRIEFKLNSTFDLTLPSAVEPKPVLVSCSPACAPSPPVYPHTRRRIFHR